MGEGISRQKKQKMQRDMEIHYIIKKQNQFISKKLPQKSTYRFCTEQQQQQQKIDWMVLSEKQSILNC